MHYAFSTWLASSRHYEKDGAVVSGQGERPSWALPARFLTLGHQLLEFLDRAFAKDAPDQLGFYARPCRTSSRQLQTMRNINEELL